MIVQLLSSRAIGAFAVSGCALTCLVVGCWMSLRPNYWADLAASLLPSSSRAQPNPFAPARGWRALGSLIVCVGFALTGVALWLLLSLAMRV
jgi:hypothetical protein